MGLNKNKYKNEYHGSTHRKSILRCFSKDSINESLAKLNVLDRSVLFTIKNKDSSKKKVLDGVLLIDLAQTDNFVQKVLDLN